jgi:hypothetical protein
MLGTGLRFVGLTRGISDFDPSGQSDQQTFYHFHPDEETLIRAALALESSFAPPLTAYGLLPLYMLRGALAFTGVLPGAPALDMDSVQGQVWIYMTARLLAAALSCLSLLLVYWLGRRCFGEWAALLATFFTAVAPVVVQQAHFYTVDGVFLLCSLVCFCVLAKALEKEEWGWAVAVGVCAGAAAAVRLNGLLLALLAAGAFVLQSRSRSIRGVCILSGSAVLVLCLLQPYLLTQPGLLWQSESSNDLAYSLGIARGELIKPWTLFDVDTLPYQHYWTALMPLAVGWVATVLFAASFLAGLRHRQALHLAVVLWPLLCFVLVGGLHTKHVRYLLPLVPFLALLAGDLCMWLIDRAASWRRLVGVVVVIGVLSAGWYGVAFARIYTGEDSRIQAGRWIVAEVPEAHAIGVEQGGFSLGGLVDGTRYTKVPLGIARLFNGKPYLSCGATTHFLTEHVARLDYIALVDVNRYAQFTAVSDLYPAVADFYTRLVAGELGFVVAARFKRYPAWGGRVFADDGVEPSFLGFDHPAVMVFARQGNGAEALARWQRSFGENAQCPDAALREVAGLIAAQRNEDALRAADRLAQAYPDWRPVDLVRTWIYARGGDEASEMAAVTRYRAGFFDVEDAHYGPWASALSFVLAEMPDLALTALGEGALQVAEYQTPAGVRRAMVNSYGEIARLLEERGKTGHAQVARRLAGDVAP